MNSDLWPRPDHRDGGQGEVTPSVTTCKDEVDHEYVGFYAWVLCWAKILLYIILDIKFKKRLYDRFLLYLRETSEQAGNELHELRAATRKAM